MNDNTAQKPQGQQLDGDNLQEVLDSGANAVAKGRQQFFTPLALARALHSALPRFYGQPPEVLVDLMCGSSNLLRAALPKCALGIDIDSRLARRPDDWDKESRTCFLNGDVTKFYPLAAEVDWRADLFALNPPYSVQWETARLAALGESNAPAVRETYVRLRHKETIDSTLATLLIALDLCTDKGEGYLICNENTATRFLGGPQSAIENQQSAIASALRKHIWLWLSIPPGVFDNVRFDFPTAVLYFARAHEAGPFHLMAGSADAGVIRNTLKPVGDGQRYVLRHGGQLHSRTDFCPTTEPVFRAIKEEYATLYAGKKRDWNIWLGTDGTIQRHLTPFQNHSRKIPKLKARLLNDLQGKHPMALVVQRATRIALVEAIHSKIWKVQPELIAKVSECLREYNAGRAPFYKLNDVQRLAYLDEADSIVCKAEGLNGFVPGERYELSSRTVEVERHNIRPNILGVDEVVTLKGQELEISIKCGKQTHTFKPRFPVITKIPKELKEHLDRNKARHEAPQQPPDPNKHDHDIADLVKYFVVPDVPDVAEVQPGRYAQFVERIKAIEAARIEATAHLRADLRFNPYYEYQVEDLARAAMHDGCVFSWDCGLGKTRAMFTLPQINGAKRVLIVAPESLHQQIIDEGLEQFGITVKPINSHADFYADKDLQNIAMAIRNGALLDDDTARFWITSYITLGYTGGDMWAPKEKDNGEVIVNKTIVARRQKHPLYRENLDNGIGHTGNGVRCVFTPSLALLMADLFDCVECDEAVRLKSNESHISLGVREMRPLYRRVLTGTPIKNHLDDIFWLCHWAAGGHALPCARWPFANDNAAKEAFANEHMIIERNHSREAKEEAAGKRPRKIEKRTPTICNIHRLWKLLAPIVLRRRKDDVGRDLVPKTIVPMLVRPGSAQNTVYKFHADNPPEFARNGEPMNPIAQVVAQLQLLRQCALCPDSPNLSADQLSVHRIRKILAEARSTVNADAKKTAKAVTLAYTATRVEKEVAEGLQGEAAVAWAVVEKMIKGGDIDVNKVISVAPTMAEKLRSVLPKGDTAKSSRSWTDHNPKQAAILKLICDLISQGEQVVVMSPFQHFSLSLYRRLVEAGVTACMLDGNTSPAMRGQMAKQFKKQKFAVLIGGQKSMGEGNSFECASHLILPSIDWAFDTNAQSIERVHRLNSKKPVTIYAMIMEGSIDARLDSVFHEKGDSSNLALDGRLFADKTEELNLGELLRDAIRNFNPKAPTIPEQDIEREWDTMKQRLRVAMQQFREWHPPIVPDITGQRTTQAQIEKAVAAAAPEFSPVVQLVKSIPSATFAAIIGSADRGRVAMVVQRFTEFCIAHPGFTEWRKAWRAFEPSLATLQAATPARVKTFTAAQSAEEYLRSL